MPPEVAANCPQQDIVGVLNWLESDTSTNSRRPLTNNISYIPNAIGTFQATYAAGTYIHISRCSLQDLQHRQEPKV